ncbi:MAG: hypothetical protein F9K40_00740 [Kofleriaceae bacterium]|nr:MAG: hypothetical protein F9K40_00740 [Kofleriaceae bacterium]
MRRRDRIALGLVASVLVVAPFALGGAPRWAICLTGVLSAGCAASFVTSRREMTRLSPLLALISLAATLTLVQVLPMPAALVELLSPGKYELVVENARSLGHSPPGWIAISLDPPATILELAKLCGYLAFAYAALRLAASTPRRVWLMSVVAAVGTAMAATAVIHVLLGAESVFGLYRPREALVRPTLAPLLNHNHLSAFMALTTPIALSLAITTSHHRRLAWSGAAALCAGVGLLAESRGGAIALALALATLGALVLVQRRGGPQAAKLKRSDAVAIGVVAMSCLVLLGVVTAGGVARDLSGTRLGELSEAGSRFQVWRESSALLDEYRLTGIGRGAFAVASPRIHDSSAIAYPHMENEYLQAVVDWGFPGAAALALVLIWLVTVGARNARTGPLEAGAFAGLVALAFENLNDFSLWMPGIAYAAIAAAVVLAWVPIVELPVRSRVFVPVRVALLTPLVVAIAIAGSPVGVQVNADTSRLTKLLGTHPDARTAEAHAAETWRRHPSSYAAAGLMARTLFAAKDRRAISVANRALVLHPTSGELHRLVAQMLLASQQRDQARTEYALALKYRFRPELLDEVIAAYPADEDLVRALPVDAKLVNELAARLANRGRVAAAQGYMENYLVFHPQDTRVLLFAANLALNIGDAERAVVSAERAHLADPSSEATVAFARALTLAKRPEEALALIQRTMERGHLSADAQRDLLVTMAEIQGQQGATDAARHSLQQALSLAAGKQAAVIHRRLAELEERSGNRHQAEWERRRAEELER